MEALNTKSVKKKHQKKSLKNKKNIYLMRPYQLTHIGLESQSLFSIYR